MPKHHSLFHFSWTSQFTFIQFTIQPKPTMSLIKISLTTTTHFHPRLRLLIQNQNQRIIMSRPNSQQLESLQKETVISSLKKQLYELKDKEHQFLPLQNEVSNIESKYDMLQDQKERIENQNKLKLEINRKNIQELRTEIDSLKIQIHKSAVHIDQVVRDISGLKRTCENKENQIAALISNNQDLSGKNEQLSEQNKSQSLKIKARKEERNVMDLENERLLKSLQDNLQLLKTLEKEARGIQAASSKLNNLLSIAEKDNVDLIDEMRSREEIVNATFKKLDSLNAEIDDLRDKTKKLEKDCLKSDEDYLGASKNLETMISQNKEQAKRIKIYENQSRVIENDLDAAILDRDSLCSDHQSLSTENKILNDEIDKTLLKIMEAERMNNELQRQLDNYIFLDAEARKLLNREEKMITLMETVQDRLALTGQNIAHLR